MKNETTIIKVGKKITGFMCFSSEQYPWGEQECIPVFGKMEQLPEKKVYPKKTLKEQINEAISEITNERHS